MSEGVIKSGHREPFTVLYKSAIRDTRLSFEMLGFLTYMLDKPPDWEFTISGMAKERGVGKDTVRRLVGRLEEVGYLMREQSHDGSGRFSANTYVLQEKPPLSENTDNGESRRRETLWGDRIFEKCGIGRDEGGDGGKTLEIRGKRRLSARDGDANYQQS